MRLWKAAVVTTDSGEKVTVYYWTDVSGDKVMRPGLKFKVEGTPLERLDFLSLMLALFLGTAALPHILIRYYTVPNPASARKSTIVAIAAIGFFYILTLFMGLGAMINGVVNPADSNMSAPLLARSFGELLFAIISAIAFATVLGTVSGLIVAASGAVAHDLFDRFFRFRMDDRQKVRAGKISAFVVGGVAIVLGILLQGRERDLPGGPGLRRGGLGQPAGHRHAAVLEADHRARASRPRSSWASSRRWRSSRSRRTCSRSTGWIPLDAPFPLSNPGIISIPLSFLTLVVVSLLTQKRREA